MYSQDKSPNTKITLSYHAWMIRKMLRLVIRAQLLKKAKIIRAINASNYCESRRGNLSCRMSLFSVKDQISLVKVIQDSIRMNSHYHHSSILIQTSAKSYRFTLERQVWKLAFSSGICFNKIIKSAMKLVVILLVTCQAKDSTIVVRSYHSSLRNQTVEWSQDVSTWMLNQIPSKNWSYVVIKERSTR